jgi:hypothetical protein
MNPPEGNVGNKVDVAVSSLKDHGFAKAESEKIRNKKMNFIGFCLLRYILSLFTYLP